MKDFIVSDVDVPLFVEVNSNSYDARRVEGVVGLKGGLCPYFRTSQINGKGCNHCRLPSYSVGRVVSEGSLVAQIDYAFEKFGDSFEALGIKTISMYNGGSAFNQKEIPRGALFYLFSEAVRHRDIGVFPNLKKVSVESREVFVEPNLLRKSVEVLDGLTLEVALGYESSDERVRNGDYDNSLGRIGLNKKIDVLDFERAVGCISDALAEVKFYVMMGAVPWLSRREMVDDVLNTVDYLHGLSKSCGMPTFIHLNPMYVAKGSALYGPWKEAYSNGKNLPNGFDVVTALEKIDSCVVRLGSDKVGFYLGLDSEGLGCKEFGEFCDEDFKKAFVNFNKTQDLESLVRFRDEKVGGLK
ncbi:hypothetical protein J4226_05110 [Candidatus Pacearchaeota archaeon]|nr:hypothetical protein [Candidatus Pacearchaeota archaeon]